MLIKLWIMSFFRLSQWHKNSTLVPIKLSTMPFFRHSQWHQNSALVPIKLWVMSFFRHSQWYKNSTPVPQRPVSSGEVWVSPTSCYFETSAVQHSEEPHIGRQAGGEYEFLISVNYLVLCLLLLFTHGCNVYLTIFHWFGWEFLQRVILFLIWLLVTFIWQCSPLSSRLTVLHMIF